MKLSIFALAGLLASNSAWSAGTTVTCASIVHCVENTGASSWHSIEVVPSQGSDKFEILVLEHKKEGEAASLVSTYSAEKNGKNYEEIKKIAYLQIDLAGTDHVGFFSSMNDKRNPLKISNLECFLGKRSVSYLPKK